MKNLNSIMLIIAVLLLLAIANALDHEMVMLGLKGLGVMAIVITGIYLLEVPISSTELFYGWLRGTGLAIFGFIVFFFGSIALASALSEQYPNASALIMPITLFVTYKIFKRKRNTNPNKKDD